MKKHTSSLDTLAKLIPALIAIVGLLVVIRLKDVARTPAIIMGAGFTALMVATYIFRPKAILITDKDLTIDRMVKTVRIPLADIKLIRTVNDDEMKWTVRTFGNGGMFGYTGKYYNRTLGFMTWYATQRKNYILIEKIDGKKIIITPDHPQNFLLDIQERSDTISIG